MNVLRADAMGLCFGVRDALRITREVADPSSVTIHGELVHNERVLVELQSRGFSMNGETNRASIPDTANVLVTAHGISDRERARLESAGKQLIDTTCPLVRRVHRCARVLDEAGFHVLVLGRRDHVEVRGIVEDLSSYDVVECVEEVRRYPPSRLAIVCQTTTAPQLAEKLRAAIRIQNPTSEIRYVDTICQPTRDRQEAIDRLIPIVEAMVVVGGKNSNNTRLLADRCREAGVPVWHIQTAADLDPRWFEGIETVGLTAGTSTLDATIDEVYNVLCRLTSEIPKTSRQWVRYFRHNATSLVDIPWDDAGRLTERERAAISRSVQIFQLGESGSGSQLRRSAAVHAWQADDPLYVDALNLFIAEEQRHADLLSRFLDREGILRIRHQWSNKIFRRLRKLAGLELMLTVLTTAELIARVYYAALRRATKSPVLRAICKQILHDETGHVHFQCQRLARLRQGRNPALRWVTSVIHAILFAGSCCVVWLTHARAFRAGGTGFRSFWHRTQRELAFAERLQTTARNLNATASRRAGTVPRRSLPSKRESSRTGGPTDAGFAADTRSAWRYTPG